MVRDDDSGSGLIPPEVTARHLTCHCKHVGGLVKDAALLTERMRQFPEADELKYMVRDARTVKRLAWLILGAVIVAMVAAISPKISLRVGDAPAPPTPAGTTFLDRADPPRGQHTP